MLVTSIFSFSHNVFYPSQKQISHIHSRLFCRLYMLSIWTSIFSFSHNVFYPLHKTNFTFSFMFILSSAHAFNLDQHFSFSHNVFYPSPKQISHIHSGLFSCQHMLSIWTGPKICHLVKR